MNFNEQASKVDEQVENEMERLRKSAAFELCYDPFE